MSKLSELINKLGHSGHLLNAAGQAVIVQLESVAETAIEAGINANLERIGLGAIEKPLDALFEGIVEKLEHHP